MPQLVALSLSIAVLGAIWAFLCLGPLSGYLVVWAGFIAWGCFFHTGGDQKALVKTICGNVFGVIVGWIALLIIVNVGSTSAIVNAIIVGVTVFFLVIVAKVEQLSAVPANVYGYAAVVGYSLPLLGTAGILTSGASNPLILVIISMVGGAIFGLISGKVAGALTAKTASA
ncbi:MAG TPA: DUF1097 domain-containing protein [Methylomirabilota bacterium]|nr:DUF1097 domain-containing protein [Methylomirabilota bacterium]